MYPKPLSNGQYEVNGVTYTSLHEAIRAMTAARNAEPVVVVTRPETKWERAQRERREARGEL